MLVQDAQRSRSAAALTTGPPRRPLQREVGLRGCLARACAPEKFKAAERPSLVTRSGPSDRAATAGGGGSVRYGVGAARLPHDRRGAGTEVSLGLVAIVRPAPELDIVRRGYATGGVGRHVMELEEPPLCAAATLMAHEGAPAAVAEPDRALDLDRDVARARGGAATSAASARSTIFPRSPSGIWCRKRSCASRSVAYVSALAVHCTLALQCGASRPGLLPRPTCRPRAASGRFRRA